MLSRKYNRSMTDQIDPGQLDEPMVLYLCGALDSVNEFGEKTYVETNISVKAMVSYNGGNEDVQNDRITSMQKMVFTIRYRSEVSVDDRFEWRGSSYNIKSIIPVGRRRYIMCNVELIDR